MNRGRSGAYRHILFDQAEVSPSLVGAPRDVGLTRILVRDRSLGRHAQTMLTGRRRQRRIPLQRPSPGFGASPVGQRKHLFGFWLKNLLFSSLHPVGRPRLRQQHRRNQSQTQDQTPP